MNECASYFLLQSSVASLYHLKFCHFLQCALLTILLALALGSGGIPSAIYAAEVQDDYLDSASLDCDRDNLDGNTEEICDNLRQLRDSQAAAAVSCVTYHYYSVLE